MNRQTSFIHQKKVLTQFLVKLNELTDALQQLSDNHEMLLDELYEEQGLMDEIYQDYKQSLVEPIRMSIADTIEKINNENIPFVEKESDFFASR